MKATAVASVLFAFVTACGSTDEPDECSAIAHYDGKTEQNGFESLIYLAAMCLNGEDRPGPDVLLIDVGALENVSKVYVEGADRKGLNTFEIPLPTDLRTIRVKYDRPSDDRTIPAEITLRLRVEEGKR